MKTHHPATKKTELLLLRKNLLAVFKRAEMLIANMDYARVSGGVCVQVVMYGNQDNYLLSVKKHTVTELKSVLFMKKTIILR